MIEKGTCGMGTTYVHIGYIASFILEAFILLKYCYTVYREKDSGKKEIRWKIPLISEILFVPLILVCFMDVMLSPLLYIVIILNAVLLFFVTVFLVWVYSYIQKKEIIELQIVLKEKRNEASYFNARHQQDEKQKIIIHDIRNHLQSIAVLNEKGERDKIASYINHITQSSELSKAIHICDNDFLNAIIFSCGQKCKEYGIALEVEIRDIADFLSEYDMTALFGNLLNNAVEAACKIQDSFIELHIIPHSNGGSIIVTMVNSCTNDPFSSMHKLSTTKNNKWRHGYGMKSIQCVIKKYHGDLQLYFDNNTHTFHTIVLLSKPSCKVISNTGYFL